ncbi:DUF2635 domain-containing protein [Paraburkholderia adhaesiva]|uniref:DUF2635 domain-containing protein n=1 Tax=Paraburkholderia adhaesiva TaxID=2883244 RepID=UPI001F1BAB84|nr:DUF2635 domain-containing protein [Paraburkholderia adhaesiva]
MQTLRIRPVTGRVVRDPVLHDLIEAPRTVPDSPFWRRRVRDGDVTLDPTPTTAPRAAYASTQPMPDTPARTTPPATAATPTKRAADPARTTGDKS